MHLTNELVHVSTQRTYQNIVLKPRLKHNYVMLTPVSLFCKLHHPLPHSPISNTVQHGL